MPWDWEKLQKQQTNRQGGPGPSPQMDEFFNKLKNLKGKFPIVWFIVAIIIILIIVSSSFYTVGVDEVGVVQRFGKYIKSTSSGLHFKIPWIEKVTNVKVRYVFKEEFGFRTLRPGTKTQYSKSPAYLDESLMLTGDLNVAVVPWIVQYKIKDPYNYLFKVRGPKGTLRDLSEAIMRLVVGDRSVNEVISKRNEIADQAEVLLQKELEEASTGIDLVTIEMQETNVPEPVQPSFNEVNQAVQEKERMIYNAKEEYNKAIPAARGNAEKTVKMAEGYALERVNKAKGDAARFLSLYSEYANAKDVTRRRIYLETLKEVLPKIGEKYIIDEEQKNVLPFLNLGKDKGAGK